MVYFKVVYDWIGLGLVFVFVFLYFSVFVCEVLVGKSDLVEM